MIYGAITGLIFILGFAYVVWVLANKEAGNIKLAGQIIAVLVALIALVVLYCGVTGKGHCGTMGGKGMMMGSGMDSKSKCAMMTNMVKKDPKMMTEMCKDPAVCKMMKDCVKKCSK
jgi:hypothetical protein